jgi:hypothetical protein
MAGEFFLALLPGHLRRHRCACRLAHDPPPTVRYPPARHRPTIFAGHFARSHAVAASLAFRMPVGSGHARRLGRQRVLATRSSQRTISHRSNRYALRGASRNRFAHAGHPALACRLRLALPGRRKSGARRSKIGQTAALWLLSRAPQLPGQMRSASLHLRRTAARSIVHDGSVRRPSASSHRCRAEEHFGASGHRFGAHPKARRIKMPFARAFGAAAAAIGPT